MAIELINRDNERDNVESNPGGAVTAPTELDAAYGVEVVTVGTSTYAYVAGISDNGVSAFSLASDGTLTPIQNIQDGDGDSTLLNGAANFAQATVDGTTYLYVNSAGDSALTAYEVGTDGTLTHVQQIADTAELELRSSFGRTAVAEADGAQFLIASGLFDDGLSVFKIGTGGVLTNTDNVTDAADARYELDGVRDVTAATVGGTTYVFAAGQSDAGVTAFALDANGKLSFADSVQDGVDGAQNLLGASGVTTATIGGTTYLVASGVNDDGLDVFSVDVEGQLTYVSSLNDGTAPLDAPWGPTSFELNGTSYVAVSANTSDALTLLELNGAGALTPVTAATDAAATELDGTYYNAFAQVDGTPLLLATGITDDGVSSFEITGGAPANTAPSADTNAGATVDEGGTEVIDAAELDTNDAEQAPDEITYTLDTTVSNGTLFVDANGSGALDAGETALAAGGTFTQADIDANRLTYRHDGSETTSDSFQFDVSDGTASVDDQTFGITVTPVNDVPEISLPKSTLDILAVGYPADSRANGQASVFLGDGDGGFALDSTVLTGGRIGDAVALADVNGDGITDALAVNSNNSTLSTLIGDGDGGFTLTGVVDPASGTTGTGVAIGDLDGDGDLDAIVSNLNNLQATLFLNDGTGRFADGGAINTFGPNSSVALGDFDGDGDLDAVLPNLNDDASVTILLNDGTATFISNEVSAAAVEAAAAALGDLNGDGTLDILTANDGSADASVLLGDGQGGFAFSGQVAVGGAPRAAALGDIDGDGDLDAVVVSTASNSATVLLNDGLGNFTALAPTSVGSFPTDVALGDVDGDGDLDVVVANQGSDDVRILVNDGTGVLAGGAILPGVARVNAVALGEFERSTSTPEDTAFTFSAANGNAITIADPDAGTADVKAGFAVTNGGLTLAQDTGLIFQDGTENGDATLTVVGSVAEINAALDGLVYRPDTDFVGSDSLSVSVDDLGNTGAGGAKTATETLAIDITPVNDAPLITGDLVAAVDENGTVAIDTDTLNGRDVDDSSAGLTYTVTDASNGQVELSGAENIAVTTFTQEDVDAARVLFRQDGSEGSEAGFTVTLADGGEDGAQPAGPTTVSIAVAPVNDAPVLVTNATETLDEGGLEGIANTDLAFSDADNAPGEMVYTVTELPANGVLLRGLVSLGVNDTFTQADINAGDVSYRHDGSETTSDAFGFSVSDGSATVSGQSHAFTITPVDDPAFAVDDAFETDEATAFIANVFEANPDVPDTDADDDLAVAAVNGEASAVGEQIMLSSGALLTLNGDGTLQYDPNGAFDSLSGSQAGATNTSALDTFTYTLESGGETNTATVSVTVNGLFAEGTIVGTTEGDVLVGGTGADSLAGGSGNDVLRGGDAAALSGPDAQAFRLYDTAFGRLPDEAGLDNAAAALANGLSFQALADAFVGSAEFEARFGTLPDAEFVDRMYLNALERAPDEAGKDFWLDFLATGGSRGQVAAGISESDEHVARVALDAAGWATGVGNDEHVGQAFRLYDTAFDRAPDEGGYLNGLEALDSGLSFTALADAFVGSAEFEARFGMLSDSEFVEQMYLNALERPSDEAGKQGWLDFLAGGGTRGQVAAGFSESAESVDGEVAALDAFVTTTLADRWSDVLIDGGADADAMLGGRGADTFRVSAGGGTTTIYGLETFDTLDLEGFAVDAAGFRAAVTDTGEDLVYAGAEHTIVFRAAEQATLDDVMIV